MSTMRSIIAALLFTIGMIGIVNWVQENPFVEPPDKTDQVYEFGQISDVSFAIAYGLDPVLKPPLQVGNDYIYTNGYSFTKLENPQISWKGQNSFIFYTEAKTENDRMFRRARDGLTRGYREGLI
jgi:hypothetical protein